jgi:hypothetical protein
MEQAPAVFEFRLHQVTEQAPPRTIVVLSNPCTMGGLVTAGFCSSDDLGMGVWLTHARCPAFVPKPGEEPQSAVPCQGLEAIAGQQERFDGLLRRLS